MQFHSPYMKFRLCPLIMAYTVAISLVLPAIAGESTATPSTAAPAAPADTSDASTSQTKAQPKKTKPLQAAGQLELEEYKKTKTIEINASQSKLFLIKNRIFRTSAGDVGIAEPVVVGENTIILLGKAAGETTIQIWDDEGGEVNITVLVGHSQDRLNSLLHEGPIAAFDRLMEQRANGSGSSKRRGKLELTKCADPREMGASNYQRKISAELEKLALILAEKSARPSAQQETQARQTATKAARPDADGKTRQDTLSFPGGETVVITSGFKTQKTSRSLDLIASQSRTFRSKNNIVRINTTDPSIAEPTAIEKNEFVLLGKAPGRTDFEIQDQLGNTLALDLRVEKRFGRLLSTFMIFGNFFKKHLDGRRNTAPFPPVAVNPLELFEQEPSETITLKPDQAQFYNSSHSLVRIALADPGNVEPLMLSATQIALIGKRPGRTTVFLWDDVGNLGALDLQVTKATSTTKANRNGSESGKTVASRNASNQQSLPATPQISANKTNTKSDSTASSSRHECEIWTGSKKDVASLVLGNDQLCNNDYTATGFPDRDALIALNNEAVKAINTTNYARAIELLEKALDWSPHYKTALVNLGIAYNNFGLSLQNKPAEAIPYFHRALYLDASNETTQENLNGLIRKLGKDPDSFSDRVALGDEATNHGDTKGSIIEYEAALKLKDEPEVRAKLNEALKKVQNSFRKPKS